MRSSSRTIASRPVVAAHDTFTKFAAVCAITMAVAIFVAFIVAPLAMRIHQITAALR